MRLSDFQYDLPKSLIAQDPLERRTGSRLMIVDRARNKITHDKFDNLVNYLFRGDCLVLNDTRVMPARLIGRKTTDAAGVADGAGAGVAGAKAVGGAVDAVGDNVAGRADGTGASVETLLLREAAADIVGDAGTADMWEAIVKPGKRLRKGAGVVYGDGVLRAEVTEVLPSGHRILRFDKRGGELKKIIGEIGLVPLPPYIKNNIADPERYQTVYAKNYGSAAAPTAGLHFTDQYLQILENNGINLAYLTLHIGPGTFAPVKSEIIEEHRMHSEYFIIDERAASAVNKVKDFTEPMHSDTIRSPKTVCVGTTSLRALESVAAADGRIQPYKGRTDLFIYPGYTFHCADALLTNFHLPGSTLLMLVCAFAGYELMMEAYRRAVEEKYRFFSFGDAMLVGNNL